MRKTNVVVAALFVMAAGCTMPVFVESEYDLELASVERNGAKMGASGLAHSDHYLEIDWDPKSTQLEFVMTNLSSSTAKVMWDEAAYIDLNGESHRIFHSGVKFTDRASSQPPSVVIAGGKISDLIAPTDYAEFSSYGGWMSDPLLPRHSGRADESQRLEASARKLVGEEIAVFLPIDFNGDRTEYLFRFRVAGARMVEK